MRLGLLFISPWIIGFLGLTLYPLVYTFYLSFTRFGGFLPSQWIGWANYDRLFGDDLFYKSLYNTFYYTFLAVPIGGHDPGAGNGSIPAGNPPVSHHSLPAIHPAVVRYSLYLHDAARSATRPG
jgi:hypothetical protein